VPTNSHKERTGGLRDGVRSLQTSDIPGAMRLKEAAGWNQVEADWARLLDLQPDGCFALEQGGQLAATATALLYGKDLAWIGMVLTGPEFRGRGFARTLMDRAMRFVDASGVAEAGLDATDMGIALYRSFGFEEESVVERWGLPAGATAFEPVAVDPWKPDPELDLLAFGTDRSTVLASLASCESVAIPGSGYAMGRAGSKAFYFGPCVAKSGRAADQFLRWFLARHPGEPVYWDILRDNTEAIQLAEKHGFQPLRQLTRMKHVLRPGAQVTVPDNSLVFAIAGFELG
jgi:ribosomal protein S18 acetylase RimI-like enzyme